MKKTFLIFFTLVPAFILFGCAKPNETETKSEISNPVHESTSEEILETFGLTMNAPSDGQNVAYSTIDQEEGNPIAQMDFTRDSIESSYRIRSAIELEDISGAYFDWTTIKKIEIGRYNGELRYIEGKEGICLWYDAVSGFTYSLYSGTEASEEKLVALANELYELTQISP